MNYLEKLLTIAAPHDCLLCEREGGLLCAYCLPDAFLAIPSRCYRCQRHSKDSQVCASCRRDSSCGNVWVGTDYEDTAKDLVKAMKFGYKREAARFIAAYLHQQLPYLPADTLIVPIPTATSRVRQRGFDQALLIARELAKLRGLPLRQLLVRQTNLRQVGAKRQQRVQQMNHAFRPTAVSQKHTAAPVLLIDDVLTTGATIESAAKALKAAGFTSLTAAVFAQAI